MKKGIISVVMASALAVSMLAGCGGSSSSSSAGSSAETGSASSAETSAAESGSTGEVATADDTKSLTYGKSFGEYTVLFEEAVKPVLEAEGYTFTAVEVEDVIQNDIALMDGDVDFNVEQHAPYVATFNESYNADLTPTSIHLPTMPYYLFSNKYTSLDEIEDGAKLTIAVPNDGSNLPRALALCEQAGLITLDPSVDKDKVTYDDITGSNYDIDWEEMDTTSIATVLDDVDFGLITGGVLVNAGLDATKAFDAEKTVSDDMLLVLCVRSADKDKQWVKDIEAAYKSDEFKAYMKEHQKDYRWIIPEELQ